MFNLLEKLRSKSDRAKKRLALLTAFFVSGTIFVVWLSVIYPDFIQTQNKEAQVAKLEPGPLSTFTDTFFSGIKLIGDKFFEVKNTISSFTSNPAYYSATTSGQLSASIIANESTTTESLSTTTMDSN